ncbi:MAG TPA: trypsin-like peptidase domain-containing protein [Anaerolineae bacterium]
MAAFDISMLSVANGAPVMPLGLHREDVDASRYPWSAIGKLYNETGGFCSGVVISRDKILTAAHCIFNSRTRRFIPADSLHFLAGYRVGRYITHARIASYEIGPGFDPLRYEETSSADWAVLTVTEDLPERIAPLRLSDTISPSGTKAVIVGYPQDRAFAMTADGDCEVREKISSGRLLLHTCRGIKGYSGAPILVNAGGEEMQIAGIQIATFQSAGIDKMIAVPAQVIRDHARVRTAPVPPMSPSSESELKAVSDVSDGVGRGFNAQWDDLDYSADVVSSFTTHDRLELIVLPSLDVNSLQLTAP